MSQLIVNQARNTWNECDREDMTLKIAFALLLVFCTGFLTEPQTVISYSSCRFLVEF